MAMHAAIDLETLDLEPTALVLSVGVAVFNDMGGIIGTFYRVLAKDEQRSAGRTVRSSTLAWWAEQEEAAQAVVYSAGEPVAKCMAELADFLGQYPLDGVWGYGSDFDNVTLSSLCRVMGVDVPWSYRLNRCGRTVAALAEPGSYDMPERVGVHHNALDDAIFQARLIAAALNALKAATP